jgi:hypothetical protein
MPEVKGQTPESRAQCPDDLTIPPAYGRAGRGVASIVPHLNRQQRINDKPAPDAVAGEEAGLPQRSNGE